jgi:glycosyltransferase involved in cell wall biosynthesis
VTEVAALVAARDERGRIGDTVRALRTIANVGRVVVVDDGSRDDTAAEALAAGATVLRRVRSLGKGRALDQALDRVEPSPVWLLADGDLGASAAGLSALLGSVLRGEADLAIAVFPPAERGGFGLVKRFATHAIRWNAGFETTEPLSGQRAIIDTALQRVRPFANGFGLETAMTIDAVRAGLRVVEVPVPGLRHRETDRDPSGFAHRGRQGFDIARAVLARAATR